MTEPKLDFHFAWALLFLHQEKRYLEGVTSPASTYSADLPFIAGA